MAGLPHSRIPYSLPAPAAYPLRQRETKKVVSALKKEPRQGFLIAFDGLTIYGNSVKRYILTCIDVYSKIAFARMYCSKHSKNAADFLKRTRYLLNGKIENIQTDNGSEFAKDFEVAIKGLNLTRYFSRPKTPTCQVSKFVITLFYLPKEGVDL